MRQITLRIPEDTLQEAETAAEERGVSRSEYIRERLTDGVSRGEHAALQREHAELQAEHKTRSAARCRSRGGRYTPHLIASLSIPRLSAVALRRVFARSYWDIMFRTEAVSVFHGR